MKHTHTHTHTHSTSLTADLHQPAVSSFTKCLQIAGLKVSVGLMPELAKTWVRLMPNNHTEARPEQLWAPLPLCTHLPPWAPSLVCGAFMPSPSLPYETLSPQMKGRGFRGALHWLCLIPSWQPTTQCGDNIMKLHVWHNVLNEQDILPQSCDHVYFCRSNLYALINSDLVDCNSDLTGPCESWGNTQNSRRWHTDENKPTL